VGGNLANGGRGGRGFGQPARLPSIAVSHQAAQTRSRPARFAM
jgi:hypothetical protein